MNKSVKDFKFQLRVTHDIEIETNYRAQTNTFSKPQMKNGLWNSISKGTKGRNKFRNIFSRQCGTKEISSK